MRKYIYILCIAWGTMISACTDWLTVEPKTLIVAENLFTTDDGVEQALNGMYILMRTHIYNPEGVMGGTGMAECLAATWTQSANVDADLASHVYNVNNEAMANKLNSTFTYFYQVIANGNPLIEGLNENRSQLDSSVYNVVRGEALAIRACMHFELIRLWGPMPTKVDQAKLYLPYVTENSTDKYTYHTYEEYMEKLFADLNEAEDLLKRSDPILTLTADNNTTGSSRWLKRQSRFNYYGVLGLQARVRMWYGNKAEAVRYAKLVVAAENTDGTPKFTLADNALFSSFADGEWDGTFYPEHLCGLHTENYNYDLGAFGGSYKVSIYDPSWSFLTLFSNSNDLRWKVWYAWPMPPRPSYVYCIKYQGITPRLTATPKNMPVVRLAEMYLTIMESGTLAEANAAQETFCTARNLTYTPYTEADRDDRVLWEYIREFMAEGQNFFTYKRKEVKRMFNQPEDSSDCDVAEYVLPLPPKEF